ncbi:hypothetical protein GCM10027514_38070 [Azotobacter armeniacus]
MELEEMGDSAEDRAGKLDEKTYEALDRAEIATNEDVQTCLASIWRPFHLQSGLRLARAEPSA